MGGLDHMYTVAGWLGQRATCMLTPQQLRHKTVKNAGYSVGNLTPNPNSFTNETLDIDALSDAHVPTLET